MKIAILIWSSWAFAAAPVQVETTCRLPKSAAVEVLRLFELSADKPTSLRLPVANSAPKGENELKWDLKNETLTLGRLFQDRLKEPPANAPRYEFQVDMPEFLKTHSAQWKALLNDISGAVHLEAPREAEGAATKVVGSLRYGQGQDVWEFSVYQIKDRRGLKPADQGADEQGRWLVIRCGPVRAP
ncbi:MAG: hypothetical protein KF799_14645 [Bdellovibrionales bacterium]|nr:hypothetical protein [Bdellovibrionales bacterium]